LKPAGILAFIFTGLVDIKNLEHVFAKPWRPTPIKRRYNPLARNHMLNSNSSG